MELRAAMTAIAMSLAAAGCNETIMPAAEKAAEESRRAEAPAPSAAANPLASFPVAGLTSASFAANPRKFDEARALVRRAWGQDCRPGSVSEVIAGGTDSASWRIDCAGGEISTASGGASPDYIIEVPNEAERPVTVNQCARREGALRCDMIGRERS